MRISSRKARTSRSGSASRRISSFVARKLESARRLFVASPRYLELRGRPESLADLAGHDFIGGPIDGSPQKLVARRNGRAEVLVVAPRVVARSAAGIAACAVAGLGVAVGSAWMCAEGTRSGALAPVLSDYALDPVDAYVVFPSGRRTSQRSRAFADYIERALNAG